MYMTSTIHAKVMSQVKVKHKNVSQVKVKHILSTFRSRSMVSIRLLTHVLLFLLLEPGWSFELGLCAYLHVPQGTQLPFHWYKVSYLAMQFLCLAYFISNIACTGWYTIWTACERENHVAWNHSPCKMARDQPPRTESHITKACFACSCLPSAHWWDLHQDCNVQGLMTETSYPLYTIFPYWENGIRRKKARLSPYTVISIHTGPTHTWE